MTKADHASPDAALASGPQQIDFHALVERIPAVAYVDVADGEATTLYVARRSRHWSASRRRIGRPGASTCGRS